MKRENVLIVDDEKNIRLTLRKGSREEASTYKNIPEATSENYKFCIDNAKTAIREKAPDSGSLWLKKGRGCGLLKT